MSDTPKYEDLLKVFMDGCKIDKLLAAVIDKDGRLGFIRYNVGDVEEAGLAQYIYRRSTVDVIKKLQEGDRAKAMKVESFVDKETEVAMSNLHHDLKERVKQEVHNEKLEEGP